MPKPRKTWREKLEIEREPEVVDDPRGRGKMLIPRPLDVDSLMRRIQKGKLATVNQIRERLAEDFHADFTCPLTTGIFIRIAAEAAEEDLSRGEKEITPYWRVIKADGSLNEKLPGGTEAQATRLREEGHSIEPGKGEKAPKVKDFGKSLQKL
ncbi:MAG: MGMT family protein [Dehalococcoidia bacterium]|nr:MGMT family protein [Dehalococcoidia bacterium]